MRSLIVMLERELDVRYEYYLVGIERSNLDNTIVRYEIRYDVIKNLGTGASVSHGNRLYGSLEDELNKMLSKGLKEVTFGTKSFA